MDNSRDVDPTSRPSTLKVERQVLQDAGHIIVDQPLDLSAFKLGPPVERLE